MPLLNRYYLRKTKQLKLKNNLCRKSDLDISVKSYLMNTS